MSRQLRTIAAVFAALALAVAVPATTLAAPGSGPVLLSGFGASPIYVGGSSTVWFRINAEANFLVAFGEMTRSPSPTRCLPDWSLAARPA